MLFKRLIFFSLVALFVLGGCRTPLSPLTTTFKQTVMTIEYRITIGQPLSENQKRFIQGLIGNTFEEINSIYNKWNPHSELSKLNQAPAHQPIPVSPLLFAFLQRTGELVKMTEGRFDPTIEPLQQLWKKHLANKQVPSQEELDALTPCLGWDKIELKEGFFTKQDARTQLDLGGIAKGLCVDLLVERLQKAGFPHVFVEWGGEIRAAGSHPEGRPWTIYISRLEDTNPSHAVAHLSLVNQAIATSGDYLQFWEVEQEGEEIKIYSHVLDIRTRTPLLVTPSSIASASILADNCVLADGLATASLLFHSQSECLKWIESLQKEIPGLSCWIITRSSPSSIN